MRDRDVKVKKEDLFLKYCCQSVRDESAKSKAEVLLKDKLNWDYLLNNAEYQRIELLLYLNIKKSGWEELVPKNTMETLKKKYRNNIKKNLCMRSELKRLLEIFRENNIKVIVLKGVVLENIIYSEIGWRPISDIDLLIWKEDYGRVDNLLKSREYHSVPPKERVFWEQEYYHPQTRISIDIHWHFFTVQEYQKITLIDMNKIWEEAIIVKFEGIEVFTLSLEDTLWSLCVHFAIHHIFCDLILLFDISEFIRRYKDQISWREVISKAKIYRIKNGVYFTLYFAKTILNAQVPAFVLKRLKANYLRRLWLFSSLVNEERLISLPTALKDMRHHQWALCSWIIADSIIDSIKAYRISRQILKEHKMRSPMRREGL